MFSLILPPPSASTIQKNSHDCKETSSEAERFGTRPSRPAGAGDDLKLLAEFVVAVEPVGLLVELSDDFADLLVRLVEPR